jgi:hypothetical protein
MPLTLAHPLAAIPLLKPLRRYGVLSALIIGSMAPDFWYFVPSLVTREEAHSYEGLAYFALPAALVVFLVFHLLLKRPLLALMPAAVAARVAPYARDVLPRAGPIAVVASFVAGMATHLVWDSFTHFESLTAKMLPFLRAELFSVGNYDFHTYSLLQHVSSLLGIAGLGLWAGAWLKRAPAGRLDLPLELGAAARTFVLFAIFVAIIIGAGSPMVHIEAHGAREAIFATRAMVKTTLVGAGGGLVLAVLAYAFIWNALALRGRRPVGGSLR